MKNPARKKEVEDRAGGDGGSWVEGVGWGGGWLSAAIHLSSLMRSESCTNTDIDNIPPRTPLSSFHLSTSILCDACQSHICTSVQAARHAPHTPAVPTSKTSLPSLNASFIWPMLHSFKMNCMDAVWRRERGKKKDEQTKEEIILYV